MAFKVGEIVRLKAGAPEMIVEAADEKAPTLSALGSPTSFLGAALQVVYVAERLKRTDARQTVKMEGAQP
jgi:hypothetical protein